MLIAFRFVLSTVATVATAVLACVVVVTAAAALLFGSHARWQLITGAAIAALLSQFAVRRFDAWLHRRHDVVLEADEVEPPAEVPTALELEDAKREVRWRDEDLRASRTVWGQLVVGNRNVVDLNFVSRQLLLDCTLGPGGGADFLAEDFAGWVNLIPLDDRAEKWIAGNPVGYSDSVDGGRIIPMRDFPEVAAALVRAGFFFDRGSSSRQA